MGGDFCILGDFNAELKSVHFKMTAFSILMSISMKNDRSSSSELTHMTGIIVKLFSMADFHQLHQFQPIEIDHFSYFRIINTWWTP